MGVELTPNGTRGMRMTGLSRPFIRIVIAILPLVSRLRGSRLLNLTTVGAKSGKEHTVTLSWFPDGPDAWLVVASFGGAIKHPAWYVNMARNPDKIWVTLGSRKVRVQAESLQGAARADAWRRITAVAKVYLGYQEKTDRDIPVVRLTPAPAAGSRV